MFFFFLVGFGFRFNFFILILSAYIYIISCPDGAHNAILYLRYGRVTNYSRNLNKKDNKPCVQRSEYE